MPPNTIDLPPFEKDPQGIIQGAKPIDAPVRYEEKYGLMIIQSGFNLLAHILVGMTVAVCFLFAFRGGLPLGATPLHIVLCVAGYQLLMAEAILSLTNQNGWSSKFRLIDKRRAHWILQILGSGLAIAGSYIKIIDKSVNWNSLHGQFALVALVFTVVSMVNGLSSLWAYEVRRYIPPNLSKITHICFGTVAFAAAGISLCYGMDKGLFRNWTGTDAHANTYIGLAAILTIIVIVNPLITFYTKTVQVIKK
ncbi:eukaryotic cytochrome b561 domain-containing protein [Phthorimaea operculella]|nr:eukaryotic cytochrome b561 domain-containing protein [Phthorimaea operculella]